MWICAYVCAFVSCNMRMSERDKLFLSPGVGLSSCAYEYWNITQPDFLRALLADAARRGKTRCCLELIHCFLCMRCKKYESLSAGMWFGFNKHELICPVFNAAWVRENERVTTRHRKEKKKRFPLLKITALYAVRFSFLFSSFTITAVLVKAFRSVQRRFSPIFAHWRAANSSVANWWYLLIKWQKYSGIAKLYENHWVVRKNSELS